VEAPSCIREQAPPWVRQGSVRCGLLEQGYGAMMALMREIGAQRPLAAAQAQNNDGVEGAMCWQRASRSTP
jgi:hypothetical protein